MPQIIIATATLPALHGSDQKDTLIRRYLLPALAVALLLHIGYLYYKVGRGVAGDAWEALLYPLRTSHGDP